jgi:hypothetical protein
MSHLGPVFMIVAVAPLAALVVWGYLCSRVRRFGLLLLLLPPLFLVAISPEMWRLEALPIIAAYELLAGIGYIVGFLRSKRSKSKQG